MSDFEWIALAVVTVLSASRITRLVTFDEFPPVRWLRDKYADATDGSGWQLLAYCPWCASFWVTLAVVLSGYYTQWDGTDGTVWWLVNGTFAASYVAAMVMVRDGDDSDESDD